VINYNGFNLKKRTCN